MKQRTINIVLAVVCVVLAGLLLRAKIIASALASCAAMGYNILSKLCAIAHYNLRASAPGKEERHG